MNYEGIRIPEELNRSLQETPEAVTIALPLEEAFVLGRDRAGGTEVPEARGSCCQVRFTEAW